MCPADLSVCTTRALCVTWLDERPLCGHYGVFTQVIRQHSEVPRGGYSDGGKACVISKVDNPYNTLIALDWLQKHSSCVQLQLIDVLRGEIAHLKHS